MSGEQMRDDTLSGKKRITIRKGHRNYIPGPVLIGCQILNWATLKFITGVKHCTLSQVTSEEYIADGCESRKELRTMLRQFYPDLDWRSQVTVIRWEDI